LNDNTQILNSLGIKNKENNCTVQIMAR
jgi:hypothetical protein